LTLARKHDGLAEMYRNMERSAPAVVQHEEALRHLRQLVEQAPAVLEYREDWAKVLSHCSVEQMNLARSRDAELSLRAELQLWHQLTQANPKAPEYREGLALGYHRYALLA